MSPGRCGRRCRPRAPPGMAASSDGPTGAGLVGRPPPSPSPRAARPAGDSAISSETIRFRFAGDAGVVAPRGDAAVGGPPPAEVERRSRTACLQLAASSGGPWRDRPPAVTLDADAPGCLGRQGREAGGDLAVVRGALIPRRHVAVVIAGRTGDGRATSRGCLSIRPTTPWPGAWLGSGPRRPGADPRPLLARCCSWCRGSQGPLAPDIDGSGSPASGSWKTGRSLRVRGRFPQVWVVDDGNSRPLLRWMVSTWTASASDSSRRLRSSLSVSAAASMMRWRSQAVRAVAPSWSAMAAACSSWPTWRSRSSPAPRRSGPGSGRAVARSG